MKQYGEQILFRVPTQERLLFRLAARASNLSLSEFIRAACRREAAIRSFGNPASDEASAPS